MPVAERALTGALEHRDYPLRDIEFRDADEASVTFEGVASVVSTPYTVRDTFGEFQETIAPGAFNKTLRDSNANVGLYVNHQRLDVPLATRAAGTLSLAAVPDLAVTADMDAARSDVVIVRSALRRGEMRQMSIGFTVPKNRDSWSEDFSARTIHEVQLVEVSIVKDGANPFTSAAVRSLDELIAAIDQADPDELRRAIAHLSTLLPVEEISEEDATEELRLYLEAHSLLKL